MVHNVVLDPTMFALRLVPHGVVKKGLLTKNGGYQVMCPANKYHIICHVICPASMPHYTVYTTLYPPSPPLPPPLSPPHLPCRGCLWYTTFRKDVTQCRARDRTTPKEKKWSGYRARWKREGAEDTVCSIVHNVVSRDVTLEIHTRRNQSSPCDTNT